MPWDSLVGVEPARGADPLPALERDRVHATEVRVRHAWHPVGTRRYDTRWVGEGSTGFVVESGRTFDLSSSEEQADLRRFAHRLRDSGVAGTAIHYVFFAEMASWLVRRWPQHTRVDWREFEHDERLESLLTFDVGSVVLLAIRRTLGARGGKAFSVDGLGEAGHDAGGFPFLNTLSLEGRHGQKYG